MERKILWAGLFILAALVTGAVLISIYSQKEFKGVEISPAPIAPDFSGLITYDGQDVHLEDYEGQIVLLFFGYTNCPDECPATLARLKQVVATLAGKSNDVTVIMVTTDPSRDTPERLKSYLANFNPAFIGVTGQTADLASAWENYGVSVLDDGTTHSARVYVIDSTSRLRMTFPAEMSPDDMVSDLLLLMGEAQ
jgi:protein SCO1